ncbi:NXPE family member 3 [Oreochromis niloticus]|uniref:NXPE family member 3 n=1 Tax=Oreochromis niloticus TaxID=8128 RepID=UPI000DF2A456|nr:NXPE family member 3 [Oreochromis niloticus]
MKVEVYKRLVYGCIFLLLAAIIFMTYFKAILENNVMDSIDIPRASNVTVPVNVQCGFCKLKSLSAKEAHEEKLLLESITWPQTPPLSSPNSLSKISDPAHSSFIILPSRKGGQWQMGDKLEVLIQMCDSQGHPKTYGGDVLFARLSNTALGAGVAGQVKDYLNGAYSAAFTLLWEGSAYVEQPVCNYTDLRTGEPWLCYKPKELSCDDRINNFNGGYEEKISTMDKLFKSGINMKVSIPASGPA